MPPNPNSHDDSNGSSALLGALTGTDPQAGAAIRADNDRAATDPASPLSVAPRVQRQEPSTQIDSGPRAKVSDFPAADTNAPGLVPAAPDPARALHGYDPSDGTQFDVQLPAQAPNIGMLNDPHPAGKARLDDGPDGQPRYAVLNSAGQYLFTVDRDGNKISSGTEKTDSGHSGSLVEAGTGTALTGGAAKGLQAGEEGLQAGEEAGLAAALLAAAETGGEEGALVGAAADGVGAIPGAAIGAAINVLAVVATTELYNHSQRPRKTDSTPDSSDRVDPGLLPDITPSTSGQSSGTTTPKPGAGVRSYAEPQAPAPGARPGAADDPDTSHQRVSFPSAKPGQTNVPVLGTYWDGNSLRWAEGNPAGKQPGSFAPKGDGTISLQAHLFKLLTWNFDDIDEQYRPPVLAALAVANGAELYRKMFYGGIEIIANGLGADITKLTNSDTKKRDAELDKLKERGLPTGPLVDAVKAWWKAKAPEDRARELLGEAGAIAMLKSDGWTVNPRPQGNYSHDIVAVKDGQVMVVEAKGGKGGGVKLGESSVEGGAYGATQMTDPYLWAKLKEDADDDPAFRDWLDKHGAWDAVENEDPSRVGYRLIKTDTDGNIIVYGSTQEPVNGGVPDNTVIGKTTGNKPKTPPKGNKPGTPPDNPNPGPTLHGVALPLTAGPLDQILTPAHAWLDDLSHRHLRDLAAIARLAVPLPAIPTPQLGPWPRRTPTDQSLTVTITPTRPPTRDITKAEQRRCMIYGAHL